nr:MAG TPA: hypothetical protein [Caudoviricetes sp.]
MCRALIASGAVRCISSLPNPNERLTSRSTNQLLPEQSEGGCHVQL